MLMKINKDMTLDVDKDISVENTADILVSLYNGFFGEELARKLSFKDTKWKQELEKHFLSILDNTFDEETKKLFVALNRPFFNKLGILQDKKLPPFISPLIAFRN